MNQKKVSKLIVYLRKKHGLTQQELADKLNITPKAISKWECGIGLPDITMLKEISKVFNITTDELLNGELKEKEQKHFPYQIIIIILIILLVIVIIIKFPKKANSKIINNCTIIRTYYIDKITPSNDENYSYITIHEYQNEGIYTIKVSKLIASNLNIASNYEFTFITTDKYLQVSPDKLFNNSEIISIDYTDKVGNEQNNTSYCNKWHNNMFPYMKHIFFIMRVEWPLLLTNYKYVIIELIIFNVYLIKITYFIYEVRKCEY